MRLSNDISSGGFSVAWHLLALLLVVLVPTQLIGGWSFWTNPAPGQALLGGAAFLGLALYLATATERPRLAMTFLAAIGWYSAIYAVTAFVRPDLRYSRIEFLFSAGLGAFFAFSAYLLPPSYRGAGLTGLSSTLWVVVFLGFRSLLSDAPEQRLISSAFGPISAEVHWNLVELDTMRRAGAIEPYEDGFLLVTGGGAFYRVDWSSDSPVSRRLPLSVPLDREAFRRDQSGLGRVSPYELRVTDMVLDKGTPPSKVFVAHQNWDAADKCLTIRVSVAALGGSAESVETTTGQWRTLFDTWPCVPLSRGFDDVETGGRLGWLGEKLLLTVGDQGFSGLADEPALAQLEDNAYGKVLLLDPRGGHEVFSVGHRNPQGLLIDHDGRVWSTEHGPQGGDEINVLRRGCNYGWPFTTYGTAYGQYSWPFAVGLQDERDFTEPAFAFVPSIAPTSLIRVRSDLFPGWQGDLLIGSLIRRSVFRVRTRDDQVTYVEPISIKHRIRDLAEAADGRIVLWADGGKLIVLRPARSIPLGEVVFARCRSCHEVSPGVSEVGPSLHGIVGADVARETGYDYSPALAGLEGKWTEERLDAFLADPNGYVRGSRMGPGKVPDREERQALIAFLRTYD